MLGTEHHIVSISAASDWLFTECDGWSNSIKKTGGSGKQKKPKPTRLTPCPPKLSAFDDATFHLSTYKEYATRKWGDAEMTPPDEILLFALAALGYVMFSTNVKS